MNIQRPSAAALFLAMLPAVLAAAPEEPLIGCGRLGPMPSLLAPPDEDAPTIVRGDESTAIRREIFQITGNVRIQRGNRLLEADKAIFNAQTDVLEAEGNIRFEQDGLIIFGSKAVVNFAQNTAEVDDARYFLIPRNAHGRAAHVTLQPTNLRLEDATYTTCMPDDQDWVLTASDLNIDSEEAMGKAKGVTLRVARVPVAYLPFASFPLGKRKSGFLVPTFNVSETSGTELATPYYFNLAPNRDATLTPRYMTERGLQALGEYRYLFPRQRGELDVEYLAHDQKEQERRSLFAWRHNAQFSRQWSAEVRYVDVSDSDYFRDLGGDLGTASQAYLERYAQTTAVGNDWSLQARVQDFQLLRPDIAEPYQRLPQILYRRTDTLNNFQLNLQTEYSRFTGGGAAVNGGRVDILPSIAYPMRRIWGYAAPRVNYRYTYYDLDDQRTLERTVPTASLETGLIFERELTAGVQTLEPRLFYVYTPVRDQDDLPRFDVGLLQFDFPRLFQERRYAGVDRVGDKNNLTAAVTTRVLSDGGRERLRASIGQIRYLKDQQVSLGETLFQVGDYRTAAEATAALGERWRTTGSVQWFSAEDDPERGTFRLNYEGSRATTELSYRYVRDQASQTDVAALWRVSEKWRLAARWLYSLQDEQTLEAAAGFEYRNCCWSARLAAQRYVNEIDGDTNTSILLQVELQGLASVGRPLEEVFSGSTLGFSNL